MSFDSEVERFKIQDSEFDKHSFIDNLQSFDTGGKIDCLPSISGVFPNPERPNGLERL
jgi:hypothetical protein